MVSPQHKKYETQNYPSRGYFSSEKATRQHARRELTLKLARKLSPKIRVVGKRFVDVDSGEIMDGRADSMDLRAAAYAAMLEAAAEPENQFAGQLDGGEQGAYPAAGTLWKSSLRIDPNWMEALRRRSRRRARAAFRRAEDVLPRFEQLAKAKRWSWGLQWRLVTLGTLPTEGAKSEDEVRLANRAWRLFSRRAAWVGADPKKPQVVGGVKGAEDAIDGRGPYVHLHVLALSRRLDYDRVKAAWGECLQKAAHDLGLRIRDGEPSVSILRVTARRELRDGETSEEAAIDETIKYATKGEALADDDVPREVLIELCDVARWGRMFELFGTCREPKRPQGADLDTACISVGDLLARRPHAVAEIEAIKAEIRNQALEPEEPGLTEAELEANVLSYLRQDAKRKRKRPPSWRDMLAYTPLVRWWCVMLDRIARARDYRLRWLRTHNPLCMLADFTGSVLCDQRPADFSENFA